MSIKIQKIENLYIAKVFDTDQNLIWTNTVPLTRKTLIKKLVDSGTHPIDAFDAFEEIDPTQNVAVPEYVADIIRAEFLKKPK